MKKVLVWVLLLAAVGAAVWYFMSNGEAEATQAAVETAGEAAANAVEAAGEAAGEAVKAAGEAVVK